MYRFFWIVKAIKRILRNVNPNNTSPFYCSSHPCKYGLYAQATVRDCHEMSGDLDFSASFELRPRIDLPLMLGPPLRGEVEFSHMTKTSLNGNIQGPVLSLTGLRHPTDYSPEIKARQALFAFLSVYPKEVALVGGNSAGLPGNFLTWPWFPDEHTLWNCGIWRHISALWRKDICRSIPFYWLKGAFFKKLYLEIF